MNSPAATAQISRDYIAECGRTYLKKSRTWFTPDVVLLEAEDGSRMVLKDCIDRPWLIRQTWCRVAMAREVAVYRRLEGMNGVPHLISRVDAFGFVMEWLDARPLPRRKNKEMISGHFFSELSTLVKELHARRIAHGDLRRRNILMGTDGSPRVIDFETAVRGSSLGHGGFMFRAIAKIDEITTAKIKGAYYPDELSPEEQALLGDLPWHLLVGRFVRQNIYGPLSPKRFKKRRVARRARAEKLARRGGSHRG
jgi:hypothetical protein